MFGISKIVIASLMVGTGLFLAGCASTAPASTLAVSDKGVMCSKCQVTWVKVPQENGKGRIISYTTEKKDMCPDCMNAVTAFFNTGKLEATCKTCGADTMTVCSMHDMK